MVAVHDNDWTMIEQAIKRFKDAGFKMYSPEKTGAAQMDLLQYPWHNDVCPELMKKLRTLVTPEVADIASGYLRYGLRDEVGQVIGALLVNPMSEYVVFYRIKRDPIPVQSTLSRLLGDNGFAGLEVGDAAPMLDPRITITRDQQILRLYYRPGFHRPEMEKLYGALIAQGWNVDWTMWRLTKRGTARTYVIMPDLFPDGLSVARMI